MINSSFTNGIQKAMSAYKRGENIIKYFKQSSGIDRNTEEMIKISYDLQSGSYLQEMFRDPEFNKTYTKSIASTIESTCKDFSSILEVGVGEGTTFLNVLKYLNMKSLKSYGLDISWSRLKYALEYSKMTEYSPSLFKASLFNIPLADNSIDVVYTAHSLEPNGGREAEALKELYRVTRKYLVLIEPIFEFASVKGKQRMKEHGYIKGLYSTAKKVGYNVENYAKFSPNKNPLNPTGVIIISKDFGTLNNGGGIRFICPNTKETMKRVEDSLFCEKAGLAYPILNGIPCLEKEDAVIATHMASNFKDELSQLKTFIENRGH